MGDAFAFQVCQRLERARGLDDGEEIVAAYFRPKPLGRERHGTREVDRKACRSRRVAGEVQAARTHGLDLG